MPKFHFYDIECLDNIFTLTNYLPEENLVEQYYLADDKLEKQINNANNSLEILTKRVQNANQNFTVNNQVLDSQGRPLKRGTGSVRLYNLRTVDANIHLAQTFGLSTAENVNDPTDATNLYPNIFRPVCDTDKYNDDPYWSAENVQKRYDKKLSNANFNANLTSGFRTKIISQFKYREYDSNRDPYLLGYNSNNYDLTMLAIYLQNTFQLQDQYVHDSSDAKAEINHKNVDLFSRNETGYHYFKVEPMTPHELRQFNNYLFSQDYRDQMPSILYKASTDPAIKDSCELSNARLIRRNMIRSGRHLDVSNLNEKLRKVGLKRLLGMLGYQILESDKLNTGTDRISGFDQFCDLLAYNASDCINLKILFNNPAYQGQFELKKSMLAEYPMIVYQKQANKYEADIRPDRVKPNRMYIDSSSAQIATNVVYPYGKLHDKTVVSFDYPDKRQAEKLGIKQFNVLKQTREFFDKRVYQPALKSNPKAANKAKARFDTIMNYYASIEGKNLNDSDFYYQNVFIKYNPKYADFIKNFNTDNFEHILSSFNPLELLLSNQGLIKYVKTNYSNLTLKLPAEFVKANELEAIPNESSTLSDFWSFWSNYKDADNAYYFAKLNRELKDKLDELKDDYDKYNEKKKTSANEFADMFTTNSKTVEESNTEKLKYEEFRRDFNNLLPKLFNLPISLETSSNALLEHWGKAKLFINKNNQNESLSKFCLVPFKPVAGSDNHNLLFIDKNANPTSGYAYFSIGGVHGAEYDQKLYQQDLDKYKLDPSDQTEQTSLSGMSDKTTNKSKPTNKPQLFKQSSTGSFELQKRYVYTSIDPTNHEDFKSYYPNLCRMLMIYWNDGIGKDIYGEIYNRKEELGHLMKDPSISAEKRNYYGIMRAGTKLILNSTTGKGDTHGQNSPIQVNNNITAMRLIGQMFTWRIGQAQTLAGAKVISTNTDGLYTVMSDHKLNDKILAQESKEIHVEIDPERLILISKDSNNRMELNDKYEITSVAGSTLAAYHGPNPSKAIAHPAAIDKALGDYLLACAKPDSPYYDPELQNDFNSNLGLKILRNLLGEDANQIKDPIKRHNAKRKLLNYFQNIVSSSAGSNRYIFTSNKYLANLNEKSFNPNPKFIEKPVAQTNLFYQVSEPDPDEDANQPLKSSQFEIVQHYNRLFYVKDTSDLNTVHIYVAAGRKVPDKILAKRCKNNQLEYLNSDLASYILKKNGLNIDDLNKAQSEAKVVKLPSLPPQWACYLLNQSLDSLTEEQMDHILNNLDYSHYLELLETTYMNSWTNRKDLRARYRRKINKKYND